MARASAKKRDEREGGWGRGRERERDGHVDTNAPAQDRENSSTAGSAFQVPISRMSGPVFGCRVRLHFALPPAAPLALSIGITPVIAGDAPSPDLFAVGDTVAPFPFPFLRHFRSISAFPHTLDHGIPSEVSKVPSATTETLHSR